jgi:hypothetical protein
VFKSYAEDIRRMWPGARVVTQELVNDNVAENVISVREVYEIPDAWTKLENGDYKFTTRDISLRGTLAPLELGERTRDIYLGQPGRRTRRVDVKSEGNHSGGWMRGHKAGDALSWSDQMRVVSPNYLVVEQTLVIGALTLPGSEAETYRKIEQDLGSNDLVITETVGKKGKFVEKSNGGGGASVWDALRWGALIVFGLYWVSRLLAP